MATTNIKKIREQHIFDNFGLPELSYSSSSRSNEYGPNEFQGPLEPPLESRRRGDNFGELPDVAPGNEDLKNMRYWQNALEKPEEAETPYEALVRRSAGYKPETEATERYKRLLDEAPEREEPGFKRKLAAAGAYLGNMQRNIPGGQEAAEKALHAPYHRKMADWTARTEPFAKAADIERQNNVQERTLASNVIASEQVSRRTEAQERIANEKNRIQEEKNKAAAKTADLRAAAYAFKQYNPSWIIKEVGPRMIAYSPNGKDQHDLGPSYGMSEEDKIRLQNQGRTEAAEALGRSRESIVERQQHPDLTIGGKLHTWDTDLQTYVEKMPGPEGAAVNRIGTPPRTGGGTQNAAEDRGDRNARFRDLNDRDPSLVADGILLPPNTQGGDWQWGPPPTGWWSGDKLKRYNAARRIMGLPEVGQPAQPPAQPPPGNQPPPPNNQGNNVPPPPTKPAPNVYNRPPTRAGDVGPSEASARPREPYLPPAVNEFVKEAVKPGTGYNYNPGGITRPPETPPPPNSRPGYTWLKNKDTGWSGWMHNNNVPDALRSGKYERTQ